MRKLLVLLALVAFTFMASPAFADGETTTITTTDALKQVAKCSGKVPDSGTPCTSFVNLTGTFNGCTVHWLMSTDDGTTKTAVVDLSHNAVTSTATDKVELKWGWSDLGSSEQTIYYASVSGCSSAPSMTTNAFYTR